MKQSLGEFHKTSNQQCCLVQYMQGRTCFSREHNMHVGALKEETSRQKRSRWELSVLQLELT